MANTPISEFRSKTLGKIGLSRPSRYTVMFSLPFSPGTIFQPESVTLPSRGFATFEDDIWGPPRKIPIRNQYTGEVVMTFPVSSSWRERIILEKWMDTLVDPKTHYSDYANAKFNEVHIFCEDDSGKPVGTYTLKEAYPSMIMPTQLGYNMVNDYTRLQVAFAYRDYIFDAGGYKSF